MASRMSVLLPNFYNSRLSTKLPKASFNGLMHPILNKSGSFDTMLMNNTNMV